jgi:S-formylglutathione hydrolase
MGTTLNLRSEHACFGGTVGYYSHFSQVCRTEMRFSIYLPPQAQVRSLPILYFLSGLTCTEENFMVKAGAQQHAAQTGLVLVVPDTSPRNTGTPGEDTDWDLGTGAGFYIDATADPWKAHYQMYSYVTQELPALIADHFPVLPERQGIFGHSMGGHGALVCALRNRDRYRSVSAFAPIAAPSQCPWGQKVFGHYLGEDQSAWAAYDASQLVLDTPHQGTNRQAISSSDTDTLGTILIDQGLADAFLAEQLQPERFEQACAQAGQPLTLRRQAGYDHGYYFISTFIGDHIRFHADVLSA